MAAIDIRVAKVGNNIVGLSEIDGLCFFEGIGILVVVELALVADLGMDHAVKIVFVSGFFRLFLKQRPVP
jgi:hypothetical protein